MSYVRRDSSGSITSAGIMHHQSKLDVFIIKAHRLLSNGAVINGEDVSVFNTASSSPKSGGPVNGTSPHNDLTLFQRLSQLYNATISTSLLDDNSTSPKSAIELYQRFQQILKELELSYEVSPYGKYFRKLDNGMWQIKDDSELLSDQLWQLVSVSISTVYDAKTGQMLNQTRRRVNSMATSSKNSPSEIIDNTLPQQLQKRLQKLQQDSRHNYYSTSPVSPSLVPNGNGIRSVHSNNSSGGEAASLNSNSNINMNKVGPINNPTNISSNISSNNNISNNSNNNNNNSNNNNNNNNNNNINTNSNSINNNNNNNNINGNINNALMNTQNKRKYMGVGTPDEDAVEELLQLATKKAKSDLPTINEDMSQPSPMGHSMATDTSSVYERLLQEKDFRIKQLETDLETQRQETQWLRKMLLEDMACVRSMLHKMSRNRP
ncbi:LANO_0H04280g1_1 [Lachancea nothofagi CBS 11611]|uniref:LANO_0H04280g1_1 n=1 Tax=Lachancea nothofagi CBS 11611 TaxID=1266666 RepID=A0A1G4KL42_9SACH|nr:LANO_0H04280g1_1 [Lachancea nothofagi CBS 11611]